MQKKYKHMFSIITMGWLMVMFIYPVLHEGGHALAVIFFGGKIRYFGMTAFNARVSYCGNFNDIQNAIISISGFSLPFIIWILFITFIPRYNHYIIESIKIISSSMIIGSMIPWIVIPILYCFGKAPKNDDVAKFINYGNINCYLMMGAFLIIFIVSILFFLNRTNVKRYFLELKGADKISDM